MNEAMIKSLASLIDESLAELEELKKSDRFSASEIKLGGPGAGIAGKDSQGHLGKEDAEDEEEEEEEEEEAKKADGVNVEKAEDKAEDKDDKEDEKKKDKEEMKKSMEEQSTLFKSYVDQRFTTFEAQLEKIAKLVSDFADAPVASKSVSYKGLTPLKKSAASAESESEPLTKGAIVEKLFELKKSGTRVDSVDIASAELANGSELIKIANKYNIK